MPVLFALSGQRGACARLVSACFLCYSSMALAIGPINDTGVTGYANDTQNGLTVEPSSHPRQDARYGRDAAALAGKLSKTGVGNKGFDFTKIANDGSVLSASAALGAGDKDWACTRDNVTGLIWEVKATSGLREQNYTYTWYNSNPATNGGGTGTSSGNESCFINGRCDTEKFVQDVNRDGLCGTKDWRLPSVKELQGIVDFGRSNPTIDPTYFPNTPTDSYYWTSSPYSDGSSSAWYVHFLYGEVNNTFRYLGFSVRLVRSGN
ncbi:MAG: DUF1566 domain-containing protein [Rhodoferax sp.]|nr:DUF1566 domain-containing protein [Rhodoferax sp.]